jgi:hypothetical protein
MNRKQRVAAGIFGFILIWMGGIAPALHGQPWVQLACVVAGMGFAILALGTSKQR